MRRTIAFVVVGAVLVVLTGAWTFGPLAGTFDPAALADRAVRLRDWPAAPAAVVAFFVLGNLVVAPSTLMIATTVLLFGPARGAVYAYVGMVVSGSVVYTIGRFAARAPVERWLSRHRDPRLARFDERVARHALVAVALLRMTPIPFSLQNLVLGVARIGFAAFVVGTMLGILPITLLLAGLAERLEAWVERPDLPHAALLVMATIALLAGGWALRRWVVRRS